MKHISYSFETSKGGYRNEPPIQENLFVQAHRLIISLTMQVERIEFPPFLFYT